MKIYMIGIKGTGMSALAQILVDFGNSVKGCDVEEFYDTEILLKNKNIEIDTIENCAIHENLFYIIGNAWKNHWVSRKIIERNLKFLFYPEAVSTLIPGIQIAVSGCHGKTTTTKMISDFLSDSCSALIGDGTGIGRKNSKYFVYEADEYQNHFLSYHPDILLITNIDYDHVDYFKSIEDTKASFQRMMNQSKNVIFFNNQEINFPKKDSNHKNMMSYSLNDSDCIYTIDKTNSGFNVKIEFDEKYRYHLPFYGEYMCHNFVGAFLVCLICGYKINQEQINNFSFPRRRFQEERINETHRILVDYAHHPTEIQEVIKAVKNKYPDFTVYCIFEPHTYSRYTYFENEIISSISNADFYYIAPIFSSFRENDQEWISPYPVPTNIIDIFLKNEKAILCILGAGNYYEKILKYFHKES